MYRDQFGEFVRVYIGALRVKGIIAYIQVVIAPKRVWGLQFYFKIKFTKFSLRYSFATQVYKGMNRLSQVKTWTLRETSRHSSPNIQKQILQTDLYTFPYRISWEKLIKDQRFFFVIIWLILIDVVLDNPWRLLGENWCWSLLELKGLMSALFESWIRWWLLISVSFLHSCMQNEQWIHTRGSYEILPPEFSRTWCKCLQSNFIHPNK